MRTFFAATALAAAILTGAAIAAPGQDVSVIATGIDRPWAIAFVPDGRAIVTLLKGGALLVDRSGKTTAVVGLPQVYHQESEGLMDVAVGPSGWLYFCFTRPEWASASSTVIARARLKGESLQGWQEIFAQVPVPHGVDLPRACRLAVRGNELFASFGAGTRLGMEPQVPTHTLGKIIRLLLLPDDVVRNGGDYLTVLPRFADARNDPAIWTLGHRNIEGLAFAHDGTLWSHEHGPKGGDELNVIERGNNYGWPLVGAGEGYDGGRIHDAATASWATAPVATWTPAIAPSGMAFWGSKLYIGALAGKALLELTLDGRKVVGQRRLLQDMGERIRDVRAGPDGALWVLTDGPAAKLLRLTARLGGADLTITPMTPAGALRLRGSAK